MTDGPRFLLIDADGLRWLAPQSNRAARMMWALRFEHRSDRSYDDQDASHTVVPNGAPAGTFSRPLCAAMTRAATDLHVAR